MFQYKYFPTPIRRTGTCYEYPAWRYEALRAPWEYGLSYFVSVTSRIVGRNEETVNNPRRLRRLYKEIPHTIDLEYPSIFANAAKDIPFRESAMLFALISDYCLTDKMIFSQQPDTCVGAWSIDAVLEGCGDQYMRELILHVTNYKVDADYKFAIEYVRDPRNRTMVKLLSSYIYLQQSDEEIAKKFVMTPRIVSIIRNIFFDFNWQIKDRTVQYMYLHKLYQAERIAQDQLMAYIGAFDVGMLYTKMTTDHRSLELADKVAAKEYLGELAVRNVFEKGTSAITQEEISSYHKEITNLALIDIKHKELGHLAAQTQLTLTKVENSKSDDGNISENEAVALIDKATAYNLTAHKRLELPVKSLDALLTTQT